VFCVYIDKTADHVRIENNNDIKSTIYTIIKRNGENTKLC